MKVFNFKKIKTVMLSSATALFATASLLLGFSLAKPVNANAADSSASAYKTDGASVRVLTLNEEGRYEEAAKQGIRFHVEMSVDYKVAGTSLFDTTQFNDNNSYKVVDGYKTYTLVLPTRLLGNNAELTVNTAKVRKIDTTNYWFTDKQGNFESVAYIHSFPKEYFSDPLTYRGIICSVDANGTETVVASTEMAERSLTWVAKQAYLDTIETDTNYWGTEDLDEEAAPIIKKYVPTYNITYDVKGVQTTEEVLWGDTPKNVPSVEVSGGSNLAYTSAWFNEAESTQVDVTNALTYNESCNITLTSTSSVKFQLTGVADFNNFNVGNQSYNGMKVYATLPVGDFYTKAEIENGSTKMVELAKDAVNVKYVGSGSFSGLQGVWTLLEGKGNGAQLRLIFAFDSSTLKNGDKLIIGADSVFYAQGIMYSLSEEYTIEYKCDNQGNESYGVFLGYLHNSDVAKIQNWVEPTDVNRKRIRVTFRSDLFINSDFEFVFDGSLPAGYTYPVYTEAKDTGVKTQINGGTYYWNEGANTILELNGYAETSHVELHGAPGTLIVQNGGYFIFEDEMYAYFNGTEWVVGDKKGSFGANAFEWQGRDATDTTEIRFTTNGNTTLTAGGTTNRWFDKVVSMKAEKMDDNAPYAVWFTDVDGSQTEITEFFFHGQTTDAGYNHIFAFKDFKGTQAGQTVTIAEGTRFWAGSEYFEATEEMTFYYNGMSWIANHTGESDGAMQFENYAARSYNFKEVGINKVRLHFHEELFAGATGSLNIESGSVKLNGQAMPNLKYHGDGNKIFEIIGDENYALGRTAFEDKIVIEAGTRLWLNNYCLEFTEEWAFTYVADKVLDTNYTHIDYQWIINNNIEISNATITRMSNNNDAGGEVRIRFGASVLTNDFYGYMAVDTSKGVPMIDGEAVTNVFAYGKTHNMIALRDKNTNRVEGDYIVIPQGTVLYSTQGTITFTEEIRGLYNGGEWFYDFNLDESMGELTADDVQAVMNDGSNEIRVRITRDSANYHQIALVDGTVTLQKANGTTLTSHYAWWYSGDKYNTDHTLIGFRGNGFAGSANGDIFTIKAGTKVLLRTINGANGYHVFTEDIGYVYQNGTWVNAEGWDVTFTLNNATASVDGKTIVSGETMKLYHGIYNVTITANNGYSITGVTNATNNLDGTYTLNVNANMNVVVSTMQSIKLDASSIVKIKPYDETQYGATLTGVRFEMNGESAFKDLTTIHYDLSINGSVTATVEGSVYHATAFGGLNLFELRFKTANLKAGDEFKIAKGTVFYGGDNGGLSYAIEFTEDIVGLYMGTKWTLNPEKIGDLTWTDEMIARFINYSDNVGQANQTYTVRIFLNEALFGGASGEGTAIGDVTIDGTSYTGRWQYHGGANKILEISEWHYAEDQELTIAAGTRIYIGSQYYVTTNTLSAVCQGANSGGNWNWTIS